MAPPDPVVVVSPTDVSQSVPDAPAQLTKKQKRKLDLQTTKMQAEVRKRQKRAKVENFRDDREQSKLVTPTGVNLGRSLEGPNAQQQTSDKVSGAARAQISTQADSDPAIPQTHTAQAITGRGVQHVMDTVGFYHYVMQSEQAKSGAAAGTPADLQINKAGPPSEAVLNDDDTERFLRNMCGIEPYEGNLDNLTAFYAFMATKAFKAMQKWREEENKVRMTAGAVVSLAKELEHDLQSEKIQVERYQAQNGINQALQSLKFSYRDAFTNRMVGLHNLTNYNQATYAAVNLTPINATASADQERERAIQKWGGVKGDKLLASGQPDKEDPQAAAAYEDAAVQRQKQKEDRIAISYKGEQGDVTIRRRVLTPTEIDGLSKADQKAYLDMVDNRAVRAQCWTSEAGLVADEIESLASARDKAQAAGDHEGAFVLATRVEELKAVYKKQWSPILKGVSRRIGSDEMEYAALSQQRGFAKGLLSQANNELSKARANLEASSSSDLQVNRSDLVWKKEHFEAVRDDMLGRLRIIDHTLAANSSSDNNVYRAGRGKERAMADNRHRRYAPPGKKSPWNPANWYRSAVHAVSGRYDTDALVTRYDKLSQNIVDAKKARADLPASSTDKEKKAADLVVKLAQIERQQLERQLPPHIMGPVRITRVYLKARKDVLGDNAPADDSAITPAQKAEIDRHVDAELAKVKPRVIVYDSVMRDHFAGRLEHTKEIATINKTDAAKEEADLKAAQQYWRKRMDAADPGANPKPLVLQPDKNAPTSGITLTKNKPLNVGSIETMTKGEDYWEMSDPWEVDEVDGAKDIDGAAPKIDYSNPDEAVAARMARVGASASDHYHDKLSYMAREFASSVDTFARQAGMANGPMFQLGQSANAGVVSASMQMISSMVQQQRKAAQDAFAMFNRLMQLLYAPLKKH